MGGANVKKNNESDGENEEILNNIRANPMNRYDEPKNNESNRKNEEILKNMRTNPLNRYEIEDLYTREDCMCFIKSKTNNAYVFGTGFFCNYKNENIPFQNALYTNNHVLNKESIELGKKIEIIYKQQTILIEMTEKRNKFTNEILDYTCIEIFEEDGIKDFFNIDLDIINKKKNSLIGKQIFLFQYNKEGDLCFSCGKILFFKNDIICHSASNSRGSSGSPLIRRYENKLKDIIGIHYANLKTHKYINLATSFDNILEDLKIKIIEKNKLNSLGL